MTSGEATPPMIADFIAWHSQSRAHARALDKARKLWLSLGETLPGVTSSELPLHAAPPPVAPARRKFGLALAASIVAAVTLSVYSQLSRYDYATETGEQRMVTMVDGSKIQLDTDTALNVDYGAAQRQVQLVRGEAYFDVAHDPDKAFVINAGFGQIRVLGTAFAIKRDANDIWVTVTRGRVEVSGGSLAQNLYLTANEQVRFASNDQHPAIEKLDAEQELSWRRGRLQFQNTSLEDVLQTVKHYDKRYWFYDVEAAKQLKLNTVVDIHNIDEWLDGAQRVLPIEVKQIGPVIWLRERSV